MTKLTKIEKLNRELSRWCGFSYDNEEDLRNYPVQSRKVMKAMRKLLIEKGADFWVDRSLVCPDLGLVAWLCHGYPRIIGFLPKQNRVRNKKASIHVALDDDVLHISW